MNKILVVDDNRVVLQMFLKQLKRLKYEAIGVESGMEALEALKGGDIDLVLMDQMMPEMDGLETFRQMNEKMLNPPPVIMTTAHGSMTLALEFMKVGGKDFMEKPIDFEILNIKMRRAIDNAKIKNDVPRL